MEAISKFSGTPYAENLIQEHLKTILKLLRDNDVSIRRRALDILYIMCSQATAPRIVEELLSYSDEPDLSIKEELVLKIAILAEKFADDLIWYIDVVVRLVTNSGDYITEDIWYRIIQIITGFGKDQNPDLQRYAANKLLVALSIPNVHENLVKIGAYVLAEYGYLISNQAGKDPYKIYETLSRHWVTCSNVGKSMLLNSYVKLANTFPELRDEILSAFEISAEHWDPDIQQRAVEYLTILKDDPQVEPIKAYVLQKMPPYSNEIQSNNSLIQRIYALKTGNTKTKDPTVLNELKKHAQEELFKSQASMNTGNVSRDFNTVGVKTVDLSSPPKTKPNNQPTSPQQADLLGDDLLDTSSSQGSSSNAQSHPLYEQCRDKIAVGANVIPIPNKLQLPSSNAQEFKALLIAETGTLYQDNNLSINYKSSFQTSIGKIAMQFVTKGQNLSNVVISVPNTGNLFFNISPVQYGDHPSTMIQCLNTAVGTETPMANLTFNQGDSHRNVNFALPIQTNKWISQVNMPQQAFDKYYIDYTTVNNDNYFRLDNFIKNPAPPTFPLSEVMKKVGALFTNGLNLKVTLLPSENDIRIVNGVGQYIMKGEGSQAPTNLPVMIQAEAFENDKSSIRISLRGAANRDVLKNLYQLIILYMQPS